LLTTFGFKADYQIGHLTAGEAIGAYEFRRALDPQSKRPLVVEGKGKELLLGVTPLHGKPWAGRFQSGPEGVDGLFATPRDDTLCVVVKGRGYWVRVLEPTAYELVRVVPIKKLLRVPNRDILLFMSYTRIAAYGRDGLTWVTEDLSWDGLEITDIGETSITGTAWDSPKGRHASFLVNLETGASEGGASPGRNGLSSQ